MKPHLDELARAQRGVFRRRQALLEYTHAEIDRHLRRGIWLPVRHGIYTTQVSLSRAAADPRSRHLLAAAARQLALSGDTVLSHESAALYHRIGLLEPVQGEPRLTLHRPAGAHGLTAHGLHVARVPSRHRVPGIPVTTAARTVVDCARSLGREAAFVAAESALRRGVDPAELLAVLEYCSGWPGVSTARDLLALAGPLSESALESRARLWFAVQGLPRPTQQALVVRIGGGITARVDFVFEEFRTVCETDGRIKYGDTYAPAEPDRDRLWAEKLREDRLRDLGLEVVRGYWSDGEDHGAALAERLRRAFVRGRRNAEPPAYRIVSVPPARANPLSAAS